MTPVESALYATLCDIRAAWVQWDELTEAGSIARTDTLQYRSFRAERLVDRSTRFLLLKFPRKSPPHALNKFLLQALIDGVVVDGTQFTFLGITEPGIKAGEVWFFEEDRKYTVQSLLDQCGGLMDVFMTYGPGKYAARLGLSFSSTVQAHEIPKERTIMLLDRTASDSTNTTDGCCIVRESAYKKIVKKALPELTKTTNLHILQVRYGGLKGVLVPYPDAIFNKICMHEDKRSKENQFVFAYRPSMLKYKGGPMFLEINNHSKDPVRARLNNAFVILLLTLGTNIASFEKLIKKQVQDIQVIGQDRSKAIQFVEVNMSPQQDSFEHELLAMLRAGHAMDEPHLKRKLQGYQANQLTVLRTRMNILIPKSCYIFGVVDEQGILKNDEVYINLPERRGILTGTVLVSRNPSYFSSDIRLLSAVDRYEQLGFLTNCIVFPRGGKTSIPNQMAGGDLDGDTYFVCWETSIMPPRTQNPGGSNELQCLKSVTSTNMAEAARKRRPSDLPRLLIELFVRMYNSSLLGSASNEWQRVVEHTPQLADGIYPRKLAKIVEVALDITKTGADFGLLEKEYDSITKEYGPRVDMNYPSPLDQLRQLVPNPSNSSKPLWFPIDQDLILRDGHEHSFNEHATEGLQIIMNFNKRLKEAIEFQKRIEADEPSRRRKKSASPPDKVRQEFQQKYFTLTKGASAEEETNLFIRASAWYQIGYERGKVSFAWLGGKFLNEIKSNKLTDTRWGIQSHKTDRRDPLHPRPPLQRAYHSESDSDVDDTKVIKDWLDTSSPPPRSNPKSLSRKKSTSQEYADSWCSDETIADREPKPVSPVKKSTANPWESAPQREPYMVTTRKVTGAWRPPDSYNAFSTRKSPEPRIIHVSSKLRTHTSKGTQKPTAPLYDEDSAWDSD